MTGFEGGDVAAAATAPGSESALLPVSVSVEVLPQMVYEVHITPLMSAWPPRTLHSCSAVSLQLSIPGT